MCHVPRPPWGLWGVKPSLLNRCYEMTRKPIPAALAAFSLAAGLTLAALPAQAQWRGPGPGFRGGPGPGFHGGPGPGAVVGGALLGLGVGALLAAPYVAPPPPVVYAPPPPAYYPPAYAYAPPAYYPAPAYGYYGR